MAWTTPFTWTFKYVPTFAFLNAEIRDRFNLLKTSIADDGSLAFAKYVETVNVIAAAATTTIDCAYTATKVTLGANITTLSFSNLPTTGKRFTMQVQFAQDATGGRTVAQPASVRLPAGGSYVVTPTASRHDWVTYITEDAGGKWDLIVGAQNIVN